MAVHGSTPEKIQQENFFQLLPAEATFFHATVPIRILKILQRHGTLGTDSGAVTLAVEKTPSGTAAAAGTTVMNGTFNMKATNDTVQEANLTATLANRELAPGDGLSLEYTGVTTALANVLVTVLYEILAER